MRKFQSSLQTMLRGAHLFPFLSHLPTCSRARHFPQLSLWPSTRNFHVVKNTFWRGIASFCPYCHISARVILFIHFTPPTPSSAIHALSLVRNFYKLRASGAEAPRILGATSPPLYFLARLTCRPPPFRPLRGFVSTFLPLTFAAPATTVVGTCLHLTYIPRE